jgi:universal stress protein E
VGIAVLSKIMVIIDPTMDEQPAFHRGLDFCHMAGSRLHVYLCLTWERDSDQGRTRAMQELLAHCLERARFEGVEATGEIEWASDWRRQAATAAARCFASIIFKSHPQQQPDAMPRIRSNYDWTLLRLAPCPVLLVKNRRDWKRRRVLAALYPNAPDEAHQKLNHQIISFAQRFTDANGLEAHIVAVYEDPRQALPQEELANICGVAEEFVHVGVGAPAEVIRDTAVAIDADLILVGTVGRDGVEGPLVGNTSERLVDHTASDVMVLN